MEKIDLNEGGTPLPVFIYDQRDIPPPILPGWYFSFEEPGVDDEVTQVGPYPSRQGAIDVATFTAHQAVLITATSNLLSFGAHP